MENCVQNARNNITGVTTVITKTATIVITEMGVTIVTTETAGWGISLKTHRPVSEKTTAQDTI